MTNTSSNIGTLFVIIMGSLIGIGTIAIGVTSYSINKQLNSLNDNFNKKDENQKENTSEIEEINLTNDTEEEEYEYEDLFDLNKDLSKYKGEDNKEYEINPGGWSKLKGGKRSKRSKKNSKKKSKKRKSVKKYKK